MKATPSFSAQYHQRRARPYQNLRRALALPITNSRSSFAKIRIWQPKLIAWTRALSLLCQSLPPTAMLQWKTRYENALMK